MFSETADTKPDDLQFGSGCSSGVRRGTSEVHVPPLNVFIFRLQSPNLRRFRDLQVPHRL